MGRIFLEKRAGEWRYKAEPYVYSLTQERERLQSHAESIADKEIQVDMLATALSSLKNNFDILSIHEKRTLIRLLVQKIVWDGKDLHIFMDGE